MKIRKVGNTNFMDVLRMQLMILLFYFRLNLSNFITFFNSTETSFIAQTHSIENIDDNLHSHYYNIRRTIQGIGY